MRARETLFRTPVTDAKNDIPPRILDEARVLRSELRRHARLYYQEARPEVGDVEYDRLFRQLQKLENAYPALESPDSPTKRIGAPPQD